MKGFGFLVKGGHRMHKPGVLWSDQYQREKGQTFLTPTIRVQSNRRTHSLASRRIWGVALSERKRRAARGEGQESQKCKPRTQRHIKVQKSHAAMFLPTISFTDLFLDFFYFHGFDVRCACRFDSRLYVPWVIASISCSRLV